MTSGSASDDARFPWGYFVATLVPVILISLLTVLPLILAPEESMGWLMLCSLLIGPVAAIVVGWGLFRIWRGDARHFPALRWLVFLPLLVTFVGFAFG